MHQMAELLEDFYNGQKHSSIRQEIGKKFKLKKLVKTTSSGKN
jgi:hypothetical protein